MPQGEEWIKGWGAGKGKGNEGGQFWMGTETKSATALFQPLVTEKKKKDHWEDFNLC